MMTISSAIDRLVTVLVWVALAAAAVLLLRWGVLDAVWRGDGKECNATTGACWAILAEKGQLILLGRYPDAEIWRPIAATIILAGAAIVAANPRWWLPVPLLMLPLTPIAFLLLMGGGVAGLSPVRWTDWGGLPVTVMLAVFGVGFAIPLAIALALARRSHLPTLSGLATAYIEVVRGVPLVTLLFMATFIVPILLPSGWSFPPILRAAIAIVIFASAYLADIFRAGLEAIPKSQQEACEALGLSWGQSQRAVMLPQALTLVIAPTVNTFIGILKDTSLVAIISISDLLLSARQALSDPVWRTHFVEVYLAVAAIYFVLCFSLGTWSKALEREYLINRTRK